MDGIELVTLCVISKSTSASALATEALACCNSSFSGTAECSSTRVPVPEPLQQKYIFSRVRFKGPLWSERGQ